MDKTIFVTVDYKNKKRVTNILTANQIKHYQCKGYYNWELLGFSIPETAAPLIEEYIVPNPDEVTGFTMLGKPVTQGIQFKE